jgi:voltage-gated potassium channel
MPLKQRTYEILEVVDPDDRKTKLFEVLIPSLIALNVVALIVQTVQSIYLTAPVVFQYFEALSVTVFSIEYVFRVWCCTESPKFTSCGPMRGRLRFIVTPLAIVDLVAVLPFLSSFCWYQSALC